MGGSSEGSSFGNTSLKSVMRLASSGASGSGGGSLGETSPVRARQKAMSTIAFTKSRIKRHPFMMIGYLGLGGDVSFFILADSARGDSREATVGAIR